MIVSETDQLIRHKLRRAIELLPKRQREALYLRYFENLTYEEIAQVMGLQRQAVANYLLGIKSSANTGISLPH